MKAESVEEYIKSISSIKKCEDIIEKHPELIVFVDEKFKKDLAVKAFNNGYLPAIEYISAEDQTPQIAKTAVEGNGLLIKFIHNPTLALLRTAVRNNPMVLALMDDKLKNYEICMDAVKRDGLMLRYVPDDLITYEMCESAVLNNAESLFITKLIHMKLEPNEFVKTPRKILENSRNFTEIASLALLCAKGKGLSDDIIKKIQIEHDKRAIFMMEIEEFLK